MKKYTKDGGYNGYTIKDSGEGWGYYVTIANGKQIRYYEFSGTYNTLDDVEKYLKSHTFNEVVNDFKEWCVYLDCVEQV